MYWHKMNDRKTGGLWRCAVRKREVQKAAGYDTVRQFRYWHAPGGGYITRRRRHLRAQREQILDRLAQLEREADACR